METSYIFFVAIIGLVFGSFINCLVWRLYKEESIMGRSACPNCFHQIAWYDNIPLLSFIILRARCRHCQKKISWQYPLVEFFTALLFILTFFKNLDSPQLLLLLLRDWLVIITFVIVFIYDFRWQLVPMLVVWPITVIVFILNLFLGVPLINLIIFGALSAVFFWFIYVVTAGRGLGEGDIWLGLLIGVLLPQMRLLIIALMLAYFIGAVVGLSLILAKGKKWNTAIAFGPFLVLGATISLLYGERIASWYLQLL